MSWFDGARFGMFVHWGPASMRGRELSWPLVGGIPVLPYARGVSAESYYEGFAAFSPRPGCAREWMRLASRAGMRYAVLTAKHHDGYAMFPTKHSDFGSRVDLVGEFVDAARKENLRVGLYYSLSDWHHPDYPAFVEGDYASFLGRRSASWERYVDFLFGQVTELLTSYGPIDVLWFDGGWERSADEWHADGLHALIRELQPSVVVNDRLPGFGDFATPEQFVPPQRPAGPWETCMTMNRSWGWCPEDTEYKPSREIVHTLCEVAGRGGNLLLNVSPKGDGSLPDEQIDRLEANETVTVRGLPVRRVKSVRELGSQANLPFDTRCPVAAELFGDDPEGEVRIRVPEEVIDPLATVIEVTIM